MRPSYTRRLPVIVCFTFLTASFGVALQNGVASAAPSTWSIQPSPNKHIPDSLNAVSCTSSTFCMAVGSHDNSSGVSRNLSEMWNGTDWVTVKAKDEGSGSNSLNGVSCTSPTNCIAAGYGSGEYKDGLIEVFNGSSWSVSIDSQLSERRVLPQRSVVQELDILRGGGSARKRRWHDSRHLHLER